VPIVHFRIHVRGRAIPRDDSFDDCVILDKTTFDPDAVFLEDIVDDDVLPRLSLSVDGLTSTMKERAALEIPGDETAANQIIDPSTTMPNADYDPEALEVYGWESSLWRKLRGYFSV